MPGAPGSGNDLGFGGFGCFFFFFSNLLIEGGQSCDKLICIINILYTFRSKALKRPEIQIILRP